MRLLLSMLVSLILMHAACAAEGGFGIAAVVNDDVITTRDVDGRINMALQSTSMKPDAETLKALRKQALDSLIDEQIRIQEAGHLGVNPTDDEINDAFGKLAGQNNLAPEDFKKALLSHPGVYNSLRHQIRAQISWTNVIKKKIRPQVNITENDVNAYLAEKAKNPAKVEYQIAEIFLRNTDANKALAQQIVNELKSGKHFSVLARQFSQGIEASKGGMLGWMPEHTLEPVLDQAIAATRVGEITPPVQSDRGIHIFLVRDKRDVLPTEEGSQRLSLKQIVLPAPPSLPPDIEAKAMEKVKQMQSQLKDCATMDEMIKKINSPLSKDLGKVRMADLPPGAVSTVKNLPDNIASDPIRASDGFVIFMVCGREQTSADVMRDDIANLIGTERLNRLQNRYYRDLRAAAYVDIK